MALRGQRQGGEEMVFRPFVERRQSPEQRLGFRGGLRRRCVVLRVKMPLQPVDPIHARGDRQSRVFLQVPLKPVLVELLHAVVEGPKTERQTPQHPHPRNLGGHDVNHQTKAQFPHVPE